MGGMLPAIGFSNDRVEFHLIYCDFAVISTWYPTWKPDNIASHQGKTAKIQISRFLLRNERLKSEIAHEKMSDLGYDTTTRLYEQRRGWAISHESV